VRIGRKVSERVDGRGRDFVETLEKSAPFTKNTSLNIFSANLENPASNGHYN